MAKNFVLDRKNHFNYFMKSATSCSHSSLQGSAERHRSALHTSVSAHSEALHRSLATFVHNLCSAIASAQAVDVKGNVAAFVQQWYSGAAARVSSLQRAHSSHASRRSETGRARAARYHSLRDQRALHVSKRSQALRDTVQEMEAESTRLQQRLSEQQSELQHEREATDQRLQAWAHEERRLLEERLARHIDMEKQALEERLAKKMSEIEEQKTLLEQRMESYKQLEQTQAELDREEMEMAERDLEQSESGRQQSDNDWKKYSKEFEEGANAISVDMEVFSSNVVEVVEHVTAELTRALAHTQQQVQEEVTKVMQANSESCSEFVRAADHTLDDVVLSTKQIMDTLIERIESTNNAAVQDITSIAASLSSLISLSQATRRLHSEQSAAAKSEVSDMSEQLSAAIVAHGELEENYLIREYRVYTPTGNTPVRVPYRYPRALAATSPHDKILARLRANRRISHEVGVCTELGKQIILECIVIESDPERQATSDSEGSVSEGNDSAVFAAPSPPSPHHAQNRSANRSHHPIVKCTSETDIYTMRKQQNQNQGKENSELRSVSHKKPSKLPAPSSLKKPLVERNVN